MAKKDHTFEDVCDLILQEQLMTGLQHDMAVFVKQNQPTTALEIATLMDVYTSSIEETINASTAEPPPNTPTATRPTPTSRATDQRVCFFCKKVGHVKRDCRRRKKVTPGIRSSSNAASSKGGPKGRVKETSPLVQETLHRTVGRHATCVNGKASKTIIATGRVEDTDYKVQVGDKQQLFRADLLHSYRGCETRETTRPPVVVTITKQDVDAKRATMQRERGDTLPPDIKGHLNLTTEVSRGLYRDMCKPLLNLKLGGICHGQDVGMTA